MKLIIVDTNEAGEVVQREDHFDVESMADPSLVFWQTVNETPGLEFINRFTKSGFVSNSKRRLSALE